MDNRAETSIVKRVQKYMLQILSALVVLLSVRTFRDSDYLIRRNISNYVHNTAGPFCFNAVDTFVSANSKMEA